MTRLERAMRRLPAAMSDDDLVDEMRDAVNDLCLDFGQVVELKNWLHRLHGEARLRLKERGER